MLGLVVDQVFKRSGRATFFQDISFAVQEVTIHRVIKWDGEDLGRAVAKKVGVTQAMQDFGKQLLVAIRSSLSSAGHWVLKSQTKMSMPAMLERALWMALSRMLKER